MTDKLGVPSVATRIGRLRFSIPQKQFLKAGQTKYYDFYHLALAVGLTKRRGQAEPRSPVWIPLDLQTSNIFPTFVGFLLAWAH